MPSAAAAARDRSTSLPLWAWAAATLHGGRMRWVLHVCRVAASRYSICQIIALALTVAIPAQIYPSSHIPLHAYKPLCAANRRGQDSIAHCLAALTTGGAAHAA